MACAASCGNCPEIRTFEREGETIYQLHLGPYDHANGFTTCIDFTKCQLINMVNVAAKYITDNVIN